VRRCHLGAAVRVQAWRPAPVEDWVVQRVAALRRCDEGVGTADDVTATNELVDLLDQRWEAGEGRLLCSAQDRVDSIFLLLAVRSILTMAERMASQLEALGKEAKAASARDAFRARFEVIKDLRDVTIHYDEYALETVDGGI
jgi:hypothetical protein